MLNCHPRLSASSAVLTCLDHDSGEPVARHGGVTHQEGVFLRGRVRPELREQEATGGDFLVQVPVLCWIGPVNAGSDDGYRTAGGGKRGPMGNVSIPRASPATTVTPRETSSRATSAAMAKPRSDALRDPTTDIAGSSAIN